MLILSLKKPEKVSPIKVWKFIGEAKTRLTFQKNKSVVGKWMREEITSLGPAFIKLGQFLSTRKDLFGKEVAYELTLLQDNIVPVPFEDLIPILDNSFGKSYKEVFLDVSPVALASASIGQVHKGILKNNKPVAIKIHKPFIAEKIREDIEVLKEINKIVSIFQSSRSNEFDSIINEYERFLESELDFRQEMFHMMEFQGMLKDLPVKIPQVSKLSSTKVLIMEYVPSIKIIDIPKMLKYKLNPKDVATNLINIFLYQILENGFVHCDPHPGNIGVLPNGNIVLYDFGNVVKFKNNFKTKINQLIISLYQRDVEEFVDLLIQLEIIYIDDDSEIIEIKVFFNYFFKYLESLDFETLKSSITQGDLQNKFQTNIKVNQDFISIFRVFTLLDGTYSLLDPEFNYIDSIAPYTEELMNNPEFFDYRAKKDIEKLRSYPRILQNTDSNILRLQQKTKSINNEYKQFQLFIILTILLENMNNLLPVLTLVVPFYIWKKLDERK